MLRRMEKHGVDRIFQIGDLVDRGPASVECVRIIRTWTFTDRSGKQRNVEFVVGNHDNNYLYGRKHWMLPTLKFFPRFHEKATGEGYSRADIHWLSQQPYFRQVPELNLTLVHGGIPPFLTELDDSRHTGFFLTRCGYLGSKGEVLKPTQKSGKFWADSYDGRFGQVIFGHTSFSKIKVFEDAIGIDCSKMGALAGIIYDEYDIVHLYEKYSKHRNPAGSSSKSNDGSARFRQSHSSVSGGVRAKGNAGADWWNRGRHA